jgi:probable phosphoglycerate mutase
MGAARRGEPGRRRRAAPLVAELLHANRNGADESDWPVVLVAHGGLIAALTAALLDIPVDNWPVLVGWAMPAGSSLATVQRMPARSSSADIKWRLDVWNASAQVANDVL